VLRRLAVASEIGLAFWVAGHLHLSRHELGRLALEASEQGWSRQVERFTRPSLDGIGNGGWVELRDEATGRTQRYGPGMFVECQAYDLLWFLRGMTAGMGRPEDKALEGPVVKALLRAQFPKGGSWPWSDDGCIHELSSLELLLRGHRRAALRALKWEMDYVMAGYVSPGGEVPVTEGKHIIKSWTAPERAPTGAEDGKPHPPQVDSDPGRHGAPDELAAILRLLLLSGQQGRHPEAARRIRLGLRRLLEHLDYGPADYINFIPLYGVADYISLVQEGLVPRTHHYDLAVERVRHLARHEAPKRPMDTPVLAELLAAVSESEIIAQDPELADRIAENLMSLQDAGGEWPMPVFLHRRAWFLWHKLTDYWRPREDLRVGRVVGDVDGFTTHHAAWALRKYAWAVLDRERLARGARGRVRARGAS
jgi:hypothetical protein